jgi:surface protein
MYEFIKKINIIKIISLDLSEFDTSSVSKMNNLFFNCIELKSLNLGNFKTFLVTDIPL